MKPKLLCFAAKNAKVAKSVGNEPFYALFAFFAAENKNHPKKLESTNG